MSIHNDRFHQEQYSHRWKHAEVPLHLELLEDRLAPAHFPYVNVPLQRTDIALLSAGLSALATSVRTVETDAPLIQPVPVLGVPLAGDIAPIIDRIAAATASYASAQKMGSSDDFLAILAKLTGTENGRRFTFFAGQPDGGRIEEDKEIVFLLGLSMDRDLITPLTLGPSLLPLATTGATPNVMGHATTSVFLEFGLDRHDGISPDAAFFVRPGKASFDLSGEALGISFAGTYGLAPVQAVSANIKMTGHLDLAFANPDLDDRENLTLAELTGTAASELIFPSTEGTLSGTFPLSARIGSWTTVGRPVLTASSTDLFSDGVTLAYSPDFAPLRAFENARRQDLTGALAQLPALADGLGRIGAFDANVPFLNGTTFGHAADLGSLLRGKLLDALGVAENQDSAFTDAADLGRLLARTLGMNPLDVGPTYDPNSRELTYRLNLSGLVSSTAPADIPATVAPFGGLNLTGTVSSIARSKLTFTFGVQLTPLNASETMADRFFLRDASAWTDVSLSSDQMAMKGILGSLTLSSNAATLGGTVGLAIGLCSPLTRRSTDPVTFRQLFEAMDNDIGKVTATVTRSGSIQVVVPKFAPTGGFLAGLSENPTLTLTALLQPSSMVTSSTNEDFVPLLRFQNLALQHILSTLNGFKTYLTKVMQNKVFGVSLATIDRTITHLMDPVNRFAAIVDRFSQNPPATLNELAAKLTAALGGEMGGVPVSIDFTTDGVLRLKFSQHYEVAEATPLNLNLKQFGLSLPNIVGVGTEGSLSFTGKLDLFLDIGVDLSNPARPVSVLFDTTKLVTTGRVAGKNLALELQMGPWLLTARAASIRLDRDGDPATDDPAIFTVGFKAAPNGRYPLNTLTTGPLNTRLDGKAMVELPIFRTDSPLGVLSLKVADLTDPARSTNLNNPTAFLTNLMSSTGQLDRLDSIEEGLDSFFKSLDNGVSKWLLQRLPLAGRSLPSVTKLFERLRAKVLAELDRLQEKTPEEVRKALFKGLGPDGLDVVLDYNGDRKISIDDLPMTVAANDKSFRMHLGGKGVLLQGLKLDFGLPALGLKIEGQVQAELGWDLWSGFGVNKTLGFYIDTTNAQDLTLDVKVTTPNLNATGKLGFLRAVAMDDPKAPTVFAGKIVANLTEPNGDDKLTLAELRGSDFSFAKHLQATLSGGLNASLLLNADFGDSNSPSLTSKLTIKWNFSSSSIGTTWDSFGATPTVQFEDVRLDLGRLIRGMVTPIFNKLDTLLEPVRPVVKLLLQPVPVFSHWLGDSFTFMKLLGLSQSEQSLVRSLDALSRLNDRVKALTTDVTSIDIGSFQITGAETRSEGDLTTATAKAVGKAPLDWKSQAGPGSVRTFLLDMTNMEGAGLQFPILTDRFAAFKLLLGQDVALFTYQLPALVKTIGVSQFFPVIGPLGVRLAGEVGFAVRLSVGFDTFGLRHGNPLDGFYIDPAQTEVRFAASVSAAAELNFWVAVAGAGGGLFANIRFVPRDPNNDGKVRGDEIAANLRNGLLGLFDVSGDLSGRLFAYVKIQVKIRIGPFKVKLTLVNKEFTIAEKQLYEFKSNYKTPTYFSSLGDAQLAAGNPSSAAIQYQKVIDLDAKSANAWAGLGRANVALRRYDQGLIDFSRALALNPADQLTWIAAGSAYLERNRIDDGVYALTRALNLDEGNRWAWLTIGSVRTRQGKWRDAAYAYSRALGLDQNDPATWSLVGDLNVQQGLRADAIYCYSRAIGIDPARTTDWLAIARQNYALGRYNECNYALELCRMNGGTIPPGMFPVATAADLIAYIASCQLPNGALTVVTGPSGYEYDGTPYYMAESYFSSLAIIGLLQAPAGLIDKFAIARAYFRWYLGNIDIDGVLRTHWYYADGRPKMAPTEPDAEDSGAAVFLSAVWSYFEAGGSMDFLLQANVRDKMERIVDVMTRLQQENGLTWGSSTYPVMQLADNAEVFAGFRDAANIFRAIYKNLDLAETYQAQAEQVRMAILTTLYDTQSKLFAVNIQNGAPAQMPNFDYWYDGHGISALIVWPALFGVIDPNSEAARFQQSELNRHWNGSPDHPTWMSRTDWAAHAYAALLVGDVANARLHYFTVAQGPFPTPLRSFGAVSTIADAGFLLKTLATAANNDSVTLSGATSIDVLANDYDLDGKAGLILGIATNAEHGKVEVTPTGKFRYTPSSGFFGMDTFTYRVTNSRGMISRAVVTVMVT